MLSISTALQGAGSAKYYLKGENVGYYLKADSEAGRWMGKGAEKLGLTGEIERIEMLHVWAGFSPDGRQELVQNAGDEQRDCAWDLTFSDPKSVSVLWGLGTPEIREAIDRARDAALKETLGWIEDNAGFSRRGQGGRIMEPAELVFAVFDHRSSRNLDPNTHAHCLLINVGVRPDGTTGALVTQEIFDRKMEAGALYRESLERHICHELPVRTEQRETGFHIVGVSEELCEHLSSRRREILNKLEELGLGGAVAAKIAALDTRVEKDEIPLESLFALWKEQAQKFGWTWGQVFTRHEQNEQQRDEPKQERKEQAQQHEESRQSQQQDQQKEEPKQESRAKDDHHEKAQNSKEHAKRNESDRSQEDGDKRQPFIRVEWRYVAPNAPAWSPVSKWKLPMIVIGSKQPRWGKVVWRKQVGNVVFKYQEKFLFPNAPRWSPMHKVSLKAFRMQTVAHERKAKRYWNRAHKGEPFGQESDKRDQQERTRTQEKKSTKQKSHGMEHGH